MEKGDKNMLAYAQFEKYLPDAASDAAKTYLESRVFPELDKLTRCARRARNAYYILIGIAALIALIIPILLLAPLSLPQTAANLAVSGAGVCVVTLLFMVVLLRLPQRAVREEMRAKELETLLHAYFLHADAFAGEDEEKRTLLLFSRVEKLL